MLEELILPFFIGAIVGAWVYSDAKDRGMKDASDYAILTFLLLIIGLPLYLIKRKPRIAPQNLQVIVPKLVCPHCGMEISLEAKFCPNCGTTLKQRF